MSVTITTGGVTITGAGVTFVAPPAPPSVATAGWFSGGQTTGSAATTTVQRITFATDTATASVRGPLTYARYGAGSTSTFTYGWVGGYGTNIERITFSSDTDATSTRGTMFANSSIAAAGNTSYGWYGGGENGSGPLSTVNRIDYSNDTGTASTRGPLAASPGVKGLAAAGNSSYGWFAGGDDNSGYISKISRIDYSNDTPTASVRGPLSAGRYGLGGTSDSSTYCWFAAGTDNSVTPTSTVNRVTTANDTVVTSVRGPLNLALYTTTGTGDTSYGYYGGNSPGNAAKSTVVRITYATDTATATSKGPLAVGKTFAAACAGSQ